MKNIELMREYMRLVEAGEKEPWKHFEVYLPALGRWAELDIHQWFTNQTRGYRIKPRTISINGFKVPEPVSSPLSNGTKYYIADPGYSFKYSNSPWCGDELDRLYLERGIIHLTREAAIMHAKALLSFTEVRNDD